MKNSVNEVMCWKSQHKITSILISIMMLMGLVPSSNMETNLVSAADNTYITGQVTHGWNPIVGIQVSAYSAKCLTGFLGNATTDASGNYSLEDMPWGDVYVKTNGADGKWWDGADGTTDCNAAVAVNVTEGNTTANIDFAYSQGGDISGQVLTSTGSAVSWLSMKVYSWTCDSGFYSRNVITNGSGSYVITGLPPGNVYVKACATCTTGFDYSNKWWDNSNGTGFCNNAGAVTVSSGSTTTNIDFTLDEEGYISGTITSDGFPVINIQVHAYDGVCGNHLQSATTDSGGGYTIENLPA